MAAALRLLTGRVDAREDRKRVVNRAARAQHLCCEHVEAGESERFEIELGCNRCTAASSSLSAVDVADIEVGVALHGSCQADDRGVGPLLRDGCGFVQQLDRTLGITEAARRNPG